MQKIVYLSFDFEECDLPREHGIDFSLQEGMAYSIEGAEAILNTLKRHQITATFFCTLNFAEHAPSIMKRILDEGHELAAHGVDHFHPTPDDALHCKQGLERMFNVKVIGYRQPRMFPVDDSSLIAADFRYNSSLNPAFIPGRYMHLTTPRRPFMKHGLLQIPASVTPYLRFPLFWLSLHLLPEWLYLFLTERVLKHDGIFVTYFHPWEFSSLNQRAIELKIPLLIRANLGEAMIGRLDRLITKLKEGGATFSTLNQLKP